MPRLLRVLFRFTLRVAFLLLLAYLGLLALLYFKQDQLIYVAGRASEEALLDEARHSNVKPWRDAAGKLIGWTRPNPAAGNRVLVFHGSAGWALQRTHFIDALEAVDNRKLWEVFILEYPGYGARPGTPSEPALVTAANAAAEELLAQDSRPLFLFGESLGSGSACAVAARHADRVAGIGLIVPYQSLVSAAAHLYPYVPVKLLLRDRFDNVGSLANYHGPVAFALAEKDEVVTFEGGKTLYDEYRGPKFLRTFPGVGHNELDYGPHASWWRELSQFLVNRAGTPR